LRTYGNEAITLDVPTLFGWQDNARGIRLLIAAAEPGQSQYPPFSVPARATHFGKNANSFFIVFCSYLLGTSVLHDLTSEMDLGLILKNSLIVCGVGVRSNMGG
jgi:hypothetical protein